jgi:hypothetical protein
MRETARTFTRRTTRYGWFKRQFTRVYDVKSSNFWNKNVYKTELFNNLHSPQIRHIFGCLENAIESGQGQVLLTQMGIDPTNPGDYEEIVELFNNILKGGS